MKIKSEATKAGVWFTFCNILQRGIQFLVTPIYTRILSPEGYGRYSTFLTWCSLVAVIATLNLANGVFNNAMVKYQKDKDGYTSSMQGLALITTVACAIVFLLPNRWLEPVMGIDVKNGIFMFSIIYYQMIVQLWSARKRYDYKYIGLILYTVIFSLLVPVLSVILYYKVYGNEEGLIVGYSIANVVIGTILLVDTWRKKFIFYRKEYWLYALKFNIPLIPHYMSNVIMGQLDRAMIKYYNGDFYAGLYSLAYQISLAMTIVSQGVNNAIVPWTYRQMEQGEYKQIGKKINLLCIGMIIPCVLLLLVAPEIMMVLGGKEFLEAIWIVPPVVYAIYLLFIIPLLLNILFYFEKNKMVMFSTATGATVNVILNMLLLEKYGYIVAAYTTVVGYFIIVMIDYLCMMKTLKDKGIEKIYDIKVLAVCLVIVAIICTGCIVLYNCKVCVRLLVLVIFVISGTMLIIKNREQIKKG